MTHRMNRQNFNSLNLGITKKNNRRTNVNTLKRSKRELFIDKMIKNRSIKTIVPGVLTISTYDKFPPLAYQDTTADGKLVWAGLDVDLMRAFAKFIGYKVKFVKETVFKGIWDKPKNGQSDLAISGIANSFEENGIMRGGPETEWTLPYFYVNRSVILKKGKTFPGSHLKIAATDGSTGWRNGQVRGIQKMGHLQQAEGDNEDFAKLRDGRINAIMHGDDVSRALIRKNRLTWPEEKPYNLQMISWEIVPTLIPKDGEIFAYPSKLGSGIATVLTAFIIKSIHNGFLESLVKKYHMDLDHFIDERKLPTGQYTPPLCKIYFPDPELSDKISKFLKDTDRIGEFRGMINGSLSVRKKNEDINERLKSQIVNTSACDNFLLSYYIASFIYQGELAYFMNNPSSMMPGELGNDALFNDEFKYIEIKFQRLQKSPPTCFFYQKDKKDESNQTLFIDCTVFMKSIESSLAAAEGEENKKIVYDEAAKEFARKCIATILYENVKLVDQTPETIYNTLFVN